MFLRKHAVSLSYTDFLNYRFSNCVHCMGYAHRIELLDSRLVIGKTIMTCIYSSSVTIILYLIP